MRACSEGRGGQGFWYWEGKSEDACAGTQENDHTLDKRKVEIYGLSEWGCCASKSGDRRSGLVQGIWESSRVGGSWHQGHQGECKQREEEKGEADASEHGSRTFGLGRHDGSLSCLLGHC